MAERGSNLRTAPSKFEPAPQSRNRAVTVRERCAPAEPHRFLTVAAPLPAGARRLTARSLMRRTVENPAGALGGHLALAQREPAVHDHVPEAHRILVRLRVL